MCIKWLQHTVSILARWFLCRLVIITFVSLGLPQSWPLNIFLMFQPNNNSVLFSKLMHDKVALEPSLVTHWKTQTPNKSTVVSSDSCLHTLNTEENAQFLQVHKLHSRTKFCYCPCIIYVCTLKKKKSPQIFVLTLQSNFLETLLGNAVSLLLAF